MAGAEIRLRAAFALLAVSAMAACKPPATDNMAERGAAAPERDFASAPLASPDSEGAIWAPAAEGERLLYGKPGERPYLALSCEGDEAPQIIFTRFAPADPHASALMPLIGNGHISRLPIEAHYTGTVWLWRGDYSADDPDLDVLTGLRDVALTIPGAGRIVLNPSPLPRDLIEGCRRPASEPDPPTSAE